MTDSTSNPEPPSNREANLEVIEELHRRLEENARAGSDTAISKQHSKSKLTIPERLDRLLDPDTSRFEVGAFAAKGEYEEHGRVESAGVRTVVGQVSDHDCIVIANDSMVKSGTWFPLTIKKILRAQQIGMENRLPLIYLVDSGGLFLPLQHDSFPDHDHAGRIFYNNARLSAMGVPQIAAVMGPCVAGGAYIPALCDEILMVKGTSGIFLGGPYLVKAAIGEDADIEALGGSFDAHSPERHGRLRGRGRRELSRARPSSGRPVAGVGDHRPTVNPRQELGGGLPRLELPRRIPNAFSSFFPRIGGPPTTRAISWARSPMQEAGKSTRRTTASLSSQAPLA